MSLSDILNIILACLGMLIVVLTITSVYLNYKSKYTDEVKTDEKFKGKNERKEKNSEYTKLSVFDFMEFDKIEDNMIVQDDGKRYLMVVECEGVNYDLMSGMEKAAVEAGFVQFLNSLRYTIQIYTQTRTVNIEESISNYKQRLDEIAKNLDYKKRKQTAMIQEGIATRKTIRGF